jgi:hypothetical protein
MTRPGERGAVSRGTPHELGWQPPGLASPVFTPAIRGARGRSAIVMVTGHPVHMIQDLANILIV